VDEINRAYGMRGIEENFAQSFDKEIWRKESLGRPKLRWENNIKLDLKVIEWEGAVPQLKRLVAGFPPRRPGFDPRSGHVGFVVDKVTLGQVFSDFGFPCQYSFHQLLHNHHHLSSGAGTIGQLWPTYQVDSVSPHPEKLKKTTKKRIEWEGFVLD
jgi:hypothetical protein